MTTPVVLIPGMMCDGRLFAPQLSVLSMRSVMIAPCAAFDEMTALAEAVLADAPPRFALGGLSMGGILAMEILRIAPERVERLALLDTNPRAELDGAKARRAPQIRRALSGDLEGVMREEMKPNYLAKDHPRTADILDLCMQMALDLGPEVFARQSRALAARRDQQETLRHFTGPALVLMGEEDALCPLDRHQLMQALMPQSRLVVIKGAGHLSTLEQPDEVNAAIADWLET